MPQELKANESQFFFMCEAESFQVEKFHLTEEVSTTYEATLDLRSGKDDIKLDSVIGKPATFFISRGEESHPYSGIVWDFRYCGRGNDENALSRYEATLKPRLCKLDLWRQTRVFQKLSYPDIIKNVLEEAGLTGYCVMELSRKYPVREYVTQYQESDFAFISRLMETAGIWYFFREPPLSAPKLKAGVTSEKFVITDKPSSFQAIDGDAKLPFRDALGMVEQEESREQESIHEARSGRIATSRKVLVKNYNYRTPDVSIASSLDVKSGIDGMVYEYGGAILNVTEAQDAALVASNRIESWRTVVAGASSCRRFRVGRRFTFAKHPRIDLNTDYVLVRVTHTGGHTGDVPTYHNAFDSLPAESANSFAPVRKAQNSRVNGVMSAFVEARGGMYASIDNMARYKARMAFDTSDTNNSEASKYLRLMQPYSGSKYGIHFPAHEGAEMLWACIGGDPDKPIGLGMVPNADTLSPVVGTNKSQSIIRTAAGNELLMDDIDKKQKIRISTPAKNVFELDDGEQYALLQTTKDNRVRLDDKNERITIAAGKHTVTMNYKGGEEGIVISSAAGHIVRIDDKNKRITIQSKAGSAIQIDDGAKSIVMKDAGEKNSVTLDGKGLTLDSKEKILISAKKDVEIKGANIKISANADMEAKAGKNMTLKGTKIDATATMKLKLEGKAGAEVKSNAITKVSGLKSDFSATSIASISGMPVKIN